MSAKHWAHPTISVAPGHVVDARDAHRVLAPLGHRITNAPTMNGSRPHRLEERRLDELAESERESPPDEATTRLRRTRARSERGRRAPW